MRSSSSRGRRRIIPDIGEWSSFICLLLGEGGGCTLHLPRKELTLLEKLWKGVTTYGKGKEKALVRSLIVFESRKV